MRFTIRPLTISDASAIAAWRYVQPYDIYNGNADALTDLAHPAAGFVAVLEETGQLAGFFCYGEEARVPGFERSGCYGGDALDLGLGLRPDLTGRGLGLNFLDTGIAYAMEQFMPTTIRLTVVAFNERAIKVYERAGFERRECCLSPVRQHQVEFLVMSRRMTPVEGDQHALSGRRVGADHD